MNDKLFQLLNFNSREIRANSLICRELANHQLDVLTKILDESIREGKYQVCFIDDCKIICDMLLRSDDMTVFQDDKPLDLSGEFTVFDFIPTYE